MPEISKEMYGLIGALVGAILAYLAARRNNLTSLKIAEANLMAQYGTEYAARSAITELLQHPEYQQRSFEQISKRVKGFEGDELRKLLVAAGAVCFEQPRTGKEFWGLRDRNRERIGPDG